MTALAQKPPRSPEPGRAGEDAVLSGYARLENDADFSFVCKGCGDCCRARRDLLLSGLDMYRIARRLGLPPRIVAEAFCRREVGAATCLPVLRLAPRGKNGDCPFLDAGACAVHAARPLACALYPLGQAIDTETGRAEYYAQTPLCGLPAEGRTLACYLADAGVTERLGADVQWAKVCTALSGRLLAAGGAVHPHFAATVRRIEKALYYDYSLRDEFYPQFRQNSQALLPLVDKLLAP